MGDIADSLEVDRIIYGDVRRTSARDDYDFSLNLHLFDAGSDEIERSIVDTIPGIRRDIDDLREPARRYVAALSGAPRLGSLRVSVNVPGAEVFIDGESVGVADENGELTVENVEAGSRNVRIAADGFRGFRSSLSVEAYAEADFQAQLEESAERGGISRRDLELGLGGTLTGIGGALAVAWIASWAYLRFVWETQERGTRSDWQDAVNSFPPPSEGGPENICEPGDVEPRSIDRQTLDELCSELDTLEALPFVFGISAAVVGGVGLYFLISALTGEDEEEATARFRLEPSVGPQHAYLGARFAF